MDICRWLGIVRTEATIERAKNQLAMVLFVKLRKGIITQRCSLHTLKTHQFPKMSIPTSQLRKIWVISMNINIWTSLAHLVCQCPQVVLELCVHNLALYHLTNTKWIKLMLCSWLRIWRCASLVPPLDRGRLLPQDTTQKWTSTDPIITFLRKTRKVWWKWCTNKVVKIQWRIYPNTSHQCQAKLT